MLDPKVSIILVNYKTAKMTADAINSVKEKTKDVTYEIIVVDNSCDSNEYQELVNEINDDNIKVIDAKENLGFGKANNLGSTYAKGEYLFFLNTDTLLINDAISILADFLDNNSNVGVVGPNLYTIDKKPNSSFMPKEKNYKNKKREESIFQYAKKLFLKKKSGFNYSNQNLEIKGFVCGAALMVRTELFNKLNGFDKDIFMYCEDSLLCYKIRQELNYKIYNVPVAKIIHFEGASIKGFTLYKAKSYINGNYIYYLKVFGLAETIKFLNLNIKVIKKKKKLFKLIKNKQKVKECDLLLKASTIKLNEILESNNI